VLVGADRQAPNVLILDEPTNHLDIESREALEDALQGYRGALLLVSHDRALLDAVGTRTIAIEDGTLHTYQGGWAEYLRVREERGGGDTIRTVPLTPAPEAALTSTPGAKPKQRKAKPQGPSKNRLGAQQKAERAIEEAEAALVALEQELADPAAWATRYEAAKSEARHTAAKRAVDMAYAKLEALID